MSKQTINIGASPNDGTGTPLRTSFDYTNQNFTEIYTALGGGVALPGATTQVIFNDGGTNLAGDAGLVFDKTTDALTVAGLVTAGSATITGALTVDTSTLKVDSTNHRVGVGTASPIAGSRLDVRSAIGTGTDIQSLAVIDTSPLAINNGGGLSMGYVFQAPSTVIGRAGYIKTIKENATDGNYASAMVFGVAANGVATAERYRIASDGTATWSVAGTTAMTLNSTGLGLFNAPVAALDVFKTANDTINRTNATFCFGQITGLGAALLGQQSASAPYQFNLQAANAANSVQFPLVLQPTGGNVGVGVTPNTWSAGYKFVMLPNGGSLFNDTSNGIYLGANYYALAGSKKIASGYALNYLLDAANGAYKWFTSTAGAGSAGDSVSLTQAMTLDASGNLLVGTTSGSFRGQFAVASGADRNVFTAQVTGASNGFQILWNHATTTTRVIISNIPTSSAGLASGTLYNDAGTIKIA